MGEVGGWLWMGEVGIWGEGERVQLGWSGGWEDGETEGVAVRLGAKVCCRCWGEEVGRGEVERVMGGLWNTSEKSAENLKQTKKSS